MRTVRSRFGRLLAALLLVGATALGHCACRKKASPTEEVPSPAVVGDESDAELKSRYHADDVFTLAQSDGFYRVLVFKLPMVSEPDSDFRVVAYRRRNHGYVRHGAELTLLNFEHPRLSGGSTPRIETTLKRLGVRYHIALDEKGAELVPSEGVLDGGVLIGHPRTPGPNPSIELQDEH